MPARFELGKITVREDAAIALALAGQEPTFFLDMHASGDWGEQDVASNEEGLCQGIMVMSRYRTLRGHEIIVMTSFSKGETYLFCPPETVVKHVIGTYDPVGDRRPEEVPVIEQEKPLFMPDGTFHPPLFPVQPDGSCVKPTAGPITTFTFRAKADQPARPKPGDPYYYPPMFTPLEGLPVAQPPKKNECTVHVEEKAKGYVVFSPANLLELPEQFPVHLSLLFDRWLKENPGVQVRHVLPIVDNGKTVLLHVWYEGQLTPKQ